MITRVTIPTNIIYFALGKSEVNGSWVAKRDDGNATKPYMKPLAFYLLLKAQAPESGWIIDYAKQIPELSLAFGISRRTFYNYIDKIEELKIAERKGNRLRLVGWKELGRALQIDATIRTTIEYKLYDKFTLHLWFAALEVEDNQELQAATLWRKVNENSVVKHKLLSALCRRKFEYADRNDRDKFIIAMFMLFIQDFETGTEVHDLLVMFRSDLNRTVKSIANAWSMSPSLVSYYKKQLMQQKIINISKIAIMSKWSPETRQCHRNNNCHVIWNNDVKERVWFLCDQISVIRPWLWQEFLNLEKAAA